METIPIKFAPETEQVIKVAQEENLILRAEILFMAQVLSNYTQQPTMTSCLLAITFIQGGN